MDHRCTDESSDLATFWQFSQLLAPSSLGGAAQAYADCPNADTIPTAENLEEIRAALICLHNEERAKARRGARCAPTRG